jgi:hypothetical protein
MSKDRSDSESANEPSIDTDRTSIPQTNSIWQRNNPGTAWH